MTTWPYPGDSREDKARRVAISYRQLVFDISQGSCDDPAGELHRLDRKWEDHGLRWHLPWRPDQEVLDPEAWLNATDLAHAIDRPRKDIYNWAHLGHIMQRTSADGTPEYHIGSVIDYQKQLRQRRLPTTRAGGN